MLKSDSGCRRTFAPVYGAAITLPLPSYNTMCPPVPVITMSPGRMSLSATGLPTRIAEYVVSLPGRSTPAALYAASINPEQSNPPSEYDSPPHTYGVPIAFLAKFSAESVTGLPELSDPPPSGAAVPGGPAPPGGASG